MSPKRQHSGKEEKVGAVYIPGGRSITGRGNQAVQRVWHIWATGKRQNRESGQWDEGYVVFKSVAQLPS